MRTSLKLVAVGAVLLGCGGHTRKPSAPAATTRPTAPAIGDGEYVFRRLTVHGDGLRLDTNMLTLSSGDATLRLDIREPAAVMNSTRVDQWPAVASGTMHGRATATADGLALDLVGDDPNHSMRITCRLAKVPVAPINARLIVAPNSACKQPSVWSLSAPLTPVVACTTRTGVDYFATSPGIEQVKPALRSDEGCDPDALLLRQVASNVLAPIDVQ